MFAPQPSPISHEADRPLTDAELGKLRWRSRRGLLENDLLVTRFYERHGAHLTLHSAQALTQLLDLPDNVLLDVLLGRTPLESEQNLNHPLMGQLLTQLSPVPRAILTP